MLSNDVSCTSENGVDVDTPNDESNEAIGGEQPPLLGDILIKLGLEALIDTFSKEQIDFDSLV